MGRKYKIEKKGPYQGVINLETNEIAFRFQSDLILHCSEGKIVLRKVMHSVDDKRIYYAIDLDKNNKIITKDKYHCIGEFRNGFAKARIDNEDYDIDENGICYVENNESFIKILEKELVY